MGVCRIGVVADGFCDRLMHSFAAILRDGGVSLSVVLLRWD